MCSSTKVFIYNGFGVSSECAEDVSDFLKNSRGIFAADSKDVDVAFFSSPMNTDGLNRPVFVVPGGSALLMGQGLTSVFERIRKTRVGNNFHYIGSCSGAMLATTECDIFSSCPDYEFVPGDGWMSLNLIDDFKSVGAFCPGPKVKQFPAYNPRFKPPEMPYAVELAVSGYRKPVHQLLVNGPGFFAVKPPKERVTEVVALYKEQDSYSFNYKKGRVTVDQFPAALARKPTDKRGGVFLSGTHFYASVENSRLLKAFETNSKEAVALPADDYSSLQDLGVRENTRVAVETLIGKTFK